jgi:hypothetical protein
VTDYTGLGRSQLLALLEKSERMRAAVARDRESALQMVDAANAQREAATRERDDARVLARCLAHAWDHDTRPLEDWLTTARQWDAYGQVIAHSKSGEVEPR